MSRESSTPPGPPRPGPEHARLNPFAGRFRTRVTIYMGPGQAYESTGIMVNSWQLDGLYLYQDYVSDPHEGPFPRFAGKGFWGYDLAGGRYEGFWIDNASTTMQRETGDVDASGRVWTMRGEVTHPATGEAIKKRSVTTLIDDNHYEMESFFERPGDEDLRTMRIEFERVAEP